eukprot:6658694-Prymnesium_polylepis.1
MASATRSMERSPDMRLVPRYEVGPPICSSDFFEVTYSQPLTEVPYCQSMPRKAENHLEDFALTAKRLD